MFNASLIIIRIKQCNYVVYNYLRNLFAREFDFVLGACVLSKISPLFPLAPFKNLDKSFASKLRFKTASILDFHFRLLTKTIDFGIELTRDDALTTTSVEFLTNAISSQCWLPHANARLFSVQHGTLTSKL